MRNPWRKLFLALPLAHQKQLNSTGDGDRAVEPLQCFEVTHPVLSPHGFVGGNETLGNPREGPEPKSCVVTLMDHVFGNSYGQPFVANYEPPSAPACSLRYSFNRVIVNLTVVSEGRQFDRLAIMWLNDTEVWRTSTAEPKPHPGIAWTYWKDMTNYLALWKQPQKLIFDLGNLVNEKYTGTFNATLIATFFEDKDLNSPLAPPADQILPISAGRGSGGAKNQGSAWTYPDEKAEVSVSLPRNIKRAVVSIAATGQSDEEFWWSNVPEAGKNVFNGTTLLGKGSFREVRLYIDGKIAGLSWPYPVVFTGGISPPLHRPIVGPQAFDLKEQEIDVTPWLGVLCNGKPHVFSIEVVGADDAVVNRFWLLSAKIFLWLDQPGYITTGPAPRVSLTKPNYEPRVASLPNRYLRYDQTIERRLEIKSFIDTPTRVNAVWTQTFSMRNKGYVQDSGNIQNVTASYDGQDLATSDVARVYYAKYSYPILASFKQTTPDGQYSLTLDANLTQKMDLTVTGKAVFSNGIEPFLPLLKRRMSGTSVATEKTGRAFFWQKDDGKTSGGFGSSHQYYELGYQNVYTESPGIALGKRLYWRDISVVNETITDDTQWAYGLEYLPTLGKPDWTVSEHDQSQSHPNAYAAKFVRGQRQADAMVQNPHPGLVVNLVNRAVQ
ncbi:hypothetical protein QQS21_001606 [Conoideocrella luteorostrata]|uniref:Peptide N-acetyl-beta-D-glucosaminyl asparaginase amidase A N-terminal domain-containing protein n=1 Tax=Conoideocrella luteorostrata TaxID=1105319 RepID=A0AAJ0FXB1_9HYPO|nr:hypothetical protein QQS21_001606 [Conoideocrella luteorostrata]